MRRLSYLMMFLMAVLLAACGGGGGSPGLSSGPVSAFSVTAPAALTMQVGLIQSFAIQGGVKPYSVFSSDAAVAVGWMVGDNTVALGTVTAGKATVTIQDVKGSKFDMVVTSGSSTAFYTTAAATMTITPGAAYSQTYTLGGGTGPYVATSSFPSVATVVVNGKQMTITGMQISATTSNIIIRDAAGATLTVAVTVGTVPLAVNPTDPTIATGSILRSLITGGTPPYRTIVLDNCLIDVKIVQGNILEAKGNKECTGSVISVVDSNNQSVNLNVTINPGSSALQVIPSDFTVPESTNTPDITLLLYGANGGKLQVFSTDMTVLAPKNLDPAPTSTSTSTITLTGGNTCSLPVVQAVAAVPGVDNTVPKDGDFTDIADLTLVPPSPTQPISDQPPLAAVPGTGGDRTITLTVIDSTGRQGTATMRVKDTDGKADCS
jgi:hypothetical protein